MSLEWDEIQGIQQKNEPGVNFIKTEYLIPDKIVGSIIGLGGERIRKLQDETGCRIKWGPKNCGVYHRLFTLTGSRQSVEDAKYVIDQIISKANRQFQSGEARHRKLVTEMMIPGLKVGLLIGKGGENLRSLQEKAGVKMVIVQDEPEVTTDDKPLRISGDPENVQFAKEIVNDFLAENDTFSVPADKCGWVIGKGGKTIREIQQQSGARLQKVSKYSSNLDEEIFIIRGDPEEITHAKTLIKKIIYGEDEIWSSGGNYGCPPHLQRDAGQGDGYFSILIYFLIIFIFVGFLMPNS